MATPDFAAIPEGAFRMGADDGPHPEDGEGPVREVHLSAYRIATTTVTNALFAAFAEATGYVTTAETRGHSQVFAGQLRDADDHPPASPVTPWWRQVAGACWRRPDGEKAARESLPVVHVSLPDALAFCAWTGTRLPSEAEWERAAQDQRGIEPHIWQGFFPDRPRGPVGPRPALDGAPNVHGLRHACGNVWEWTADRFARLHSPRPVRDPKGPLSGTRFVVKGGSFLCAPSCCARFRPSSRRAEYPDATASHLGFRIARDARD